MSEEMSLEEYQALLKKSSSKYGAKKTEVDGFVFDSKREAERYSELKIREKAGEILELELQPRFECRVNGKLVCTYIADFRYKERFHSKKDGEGITFPSVVEDVKGVRTPVYRIKRKLVEALYDIEIKEIT